MQLISGSLQQITGTLQHPAGCLQQMTGTLQQIAEVWFSIREITTTSFSSLKSCCVWESEATLGVGLFWSRVSGPYITGQKITTLWVKPKPLDLHTIYSIMFLSPVIFSNILEHLSGLANVTNPYLSDFHPSLSFTSVRFFFMGIVG